MASDLRSELVTSVDLSQMDRKISQDIHTSSEPIAVQLRVSGMLSCRASVGHFPFRTSITVSVARQQELTYIALQRRRCDALALG